MPNGQKVVKSKKQNEGVSPQVSLAGASSMTQVAPSSGIDFVDSRMHEHSLAQPSATSGIDLADAPMFSGARSQIDGVDHTQTLAPAQPRGIHATGKELKNPTWAPPTNVKGKWPWAKTKKIEGRWVEATPPSAGEGAVPGTVLQRTAADDELKNGQLQKNELSAITPAQVASLNPFSEAPRNILGKTLHESWNEAKHELLHADDGNSEAREMLMRKLWQFRQWHHDAILHRTRDDPRIGDEGLSDWKAAGSTTLTSDIDVNLKGKRTELAVAVFNELFKKDGWTKEAGVVYDVNVYALDFMHKDTFKGLLERNSRIERHDFDKVDQSTRVSAKEGARTGSAGGGVNTHSATLGKGMLESDAFLQRVWSLVKMRLYMTGNEWAQYLKDAGVPPAAEKAVDLRYNNYMNDLKTRMLDGEHLIQQADDMTTTGFSVLDTIARDKAKDPGSSTSDPEEVKMNASNRLYEERLLEMAKLRRRTESDISKREVILGPEQSRVNDETQGLDAQIDGNLAILRDLISECAMFSNEAYVTDAAVNHAVVGLQSKIGITQTRSESMDAFNENVADALKEIGRHGGSIGEAGYKAGKYLWRMADAARNLSGIALSKVTDAQVEILYDVGYVLANEIKGSEGTQDEHEKAASECLTTKLPGTAANSPAELAAFVRNLGARVAREYKAREKRNKNRQGQDEQSRAFGQTRASPVKAQRT